MSRLQRQGLLTLFQPSLRIPPLALRDWTIVVVCAILPLATLVDLGNDFYSEWGLHVWGVAYFERYFLAHHTLPVVVNTPELVGMAFPQFYAFPLYAAAALVATITGPNTALRLLVVAAAFILASQAYLTVRQLTASRVTALVVALLVSTAPYPITNVFSRGAIPEYVAVALVSAATWAWLRFVFASPQKPRAGWLAVLCYAVGASIHPITALVGGVFSIATFLALAFAGGRFKPTLRVGIPAAILAAIILSPWLYTVVRFAHEIAIVKNNSLGYILGVDNLANRLSVLPKDVRVENQGLILTSTPYLDAQVNFPLLALAVLLACDAALRLRAKRLTWTRPLAFATGFFALFVVLAVASGSPALGAILFEPFAMMQFAYRITSYLDLLLISTTGLLLYVARSNASLFERRVPVMLVICGLLAFHSGLVKTAHAGALAVHPAPGPGPFDFLNNALRMPFGYPADDYYTSGPTLSAATHSKRSNYKSVALPVAGGAAFGSVGTVRVFAPRSEFVLTNISSFATSEVLVDGKPVSRYVNDVNVPYHTFAIRLARGTHTVGFTAHTPVLGRALRVLALLAFAVLVWLVARPESGRQRDADRPIGA